MEQQATKHGERKNLLLPDVKPWRADDGPIIELKGVTKCFDGKKIIDNLDLTVQPGGISVVFGASGSGKTVLMKLISGLLRPDSGSIKVFGIEIGSANYRDIALVRKRCGVLFQNYALFDSMTIVQNVSFVLDQNSDVSRDDAREKSAKLLSDLGLGDVLDNFPSELSGGMKKRVSVARSIIANPELLLLDDPTTGLDPILMRYVDDMILQITDDYDLTTVIVSHNLPSIFRTADVIAVLDNGSIIADATPNDILAIEDERIQKYVGRVSRSDINLVDTDKPSVAELLNDHDILVEMKDVCKSFSGREVLKGVNLKVPRDLITVLIGGSGAGKSVMMKHILGLLRADKGSVTLFGNNISDLDDNQIRELRTQIGMLFQHSALFESMSVLSNVMFPLWERRLCSWNEARDKAIEMLQQLKVSDVQDAMPSEISNGQQKRVSLARALVSNPKLMVYDEPTTGQDPIMADFIEELILEVQHNFDVTSIVISHDMASALRIADQLAMLYHGEILQCGAPETFRDPKDERVREFVYATQIDFEALLKAGDDKKKKFHDTPSFTPNPEISSDVA